jgi:hypothetical protein
MEISNIDDFVEQLMIDKGTNLVESSAKTMVKEDLKRHLVDQINQFAILAMSDEKVSQLAEIVDEADFSPRSLADFIQDSGVDYQEIAQDTMNRFRNYYLGAEA